MQPSTTRRELLMASATASTIALAGCTGVFSKKLAHEVEVYNREDLAHAFSVTVTNDKENVLYQREFNLEGEQSEEGTEPFTGDPTILSVAIDDGNPTEYTWPTTYCEDKSTRSAGGVSIYQTHEGELLFEPTCNTIYAE